MSYYYEDSPHYSYTAPTYYEDTSDYGYSTPAHYDSPSNPVYYDDSDFTLGNTTGNPGVSWANPYPYP